MRTLSCALGVVACLIASSPAEADYSKAWAAAKDNLPANTQIVATIDVAAIYKSSVYAKALDAFRGMDRDIAEIHDVFKSACGWDPFSVIDGVVIGADPKQEAGIAFVQLTIDRTKASACIESALRSMKKGNKQITVKQDGIYTVASKGGGARDSAYFPWVGTNVVAISIRPDKKDLVDAWFGQKGFAKSNASQLTGKLDSKAVFAGVFVPDKIDSWFPIAKAYGNWSVGGGKVTGTVVMTGKDAAAAKKLADEIKDEMARDLKKDRTPPSIKKIMNTISVTVGGADITIKGSATEKELVDAFGEAFMKKKSKDYDDVAEPAQSGDCAKEVADAITKMDDFSKQMCQCKVTDRACADKVNEGLTKWGSEMAKKSSSKNCKPDPVLAKKSGDIMTRYTECMTKIMMNGAQQPTPAKKP